MIKTAELLPSADSFASGAVALLLVGLAIAQYMQYNSIAVPVAVLLVHATAGVVMARRLWRLGRTLDAHSARAPVAGVAWRHTGTAIGLLGAGTIGASAACAARELVGWLVHALPQLSGSIQLVHCLVCAWVLWAELSLCTKISQLEKPPPPTAARKKTN